MKAHIEQLAALPEPALVEQFETHKAVRETKPYLQRLLTIFCIEK
jgi:hypothetical protein